MSRPATAPAGIADGDLAQLLLIRHFELRVLDLFGRGLVGGTTHTCLGQEYIPVALNPLLGPEDAVFSNHRGHGHYLARFDDPAGLLAEITGRQGAVSGGRGGSQHIHRPGYLSTGVQGQLVPVAVGVALDLRRSGTDGLALAYIGDGTWGQGVVYESLNLASLLPVPLVVVVENNGIAQSSPTTTQMAGTVAGRCAAFDVPYLHIGGTDLAEIRTALDKPLRTVRDEGRPLVVEFTTVRLGPHSKGDDTRAAEEIAAAAEQDWLPRYARAHPDQTQRVERAQRDRMAAVVEDVLARPLAGSADE